MENTNDWSYVDLEISYVSTFEVQATATVLTPEGSMYSFGCRYNAPTANMMTLAHNVPELLLKTIQDDLRLECEMHIGDSQTTNYGHN